MVGMKRKERHRILWAGLYGKRHEERRGVMGEKG